jgi:hypothetical protein
VAGPSDFQGDQALQLAKDAFDAIVEGLAAHDSIGSVNVSPALVT